MKIPESTFSPCRFSLNVKIGIRRLLAQDNLLAGLPILCSGQWRSRFSFPLQLRDSRGIAPLSVAYSSFIEHKKTQSSLEDWGLIDTINPHQVLTPKTVREHPCRSSGSPFAVRLPNSGTSQWHVLAAGMAQCYGPGLQRRVRSRFARDSLRLDVVDMWMLYNMAGPAKSKCFCRHLCFACCYGL